MNIEPAILAASHIAATLAASRHGMLDAKNIEDVAKTAVKIVRAIEKELRAG